MSFDENEVSASIDAVLTEEECQKIVADAIKQNADKDQEDLTAYPSSSIIPPDEDQKVMLRSVFNRSCRVCYYHLLTSFLRFSYLLYYTATTVNIIHIMTIIYVILNHYLILTKLNL